MEFAWNFIKKVWLIKLQGGYYRDNLDINFVWRLSDDLIYLFSL